MDNRKKTCHVLRLDLKDSREGSVRKEGGGHCVAEDGKGVATNSGKCNTRV